ncbi:hypothetical protein OG413_44465 [Streptomyces sp. NBC_01433]|uniref:hypothetical protein n=1 Tax=Streptomyces sp. NBC_01433 TaxID=2903864 RepID=UPI002253C808|nr:hypothetical protein [Streptomyces sp. NBC_01433]MCX4682239.1 hypothetical protein [Streptomyces sp. NBC_01433]
MPPSAPDPRRAALTSALLPLLRASCPSDAGGYGGSVEVRLPDAEVEELGGADLLRASLRAAAQQLGWKIETYAMTGTRHGTMLGVIDRRPVPEAFTTVVAADIARRTRAAVDRVGRPGSPAPQPSPVCDPHIPTGEFRAACTTAGLRAPDPV